MKFVLKMNDVVFTTKYGEVFNFTRDEVDSWHVDYSSGKFTIKDIADCHSCITRDDLAGFFRDLGLTKSGPARAPWVLQANAGSIEELAEASIGDLDRQYKLAFERKQGDALMREYKKISDQKFQLESMAKMIASFPEINVVTPIVNVGRQPSRKETINLVSIMSDWHIGACGSKDLMAVGEPYNLATAKERINKLNLDMQSMYRNYDIQKVHLFCLGDMIDDVLSQTYPNQAAHQELHGISQVMVAIELIVQNITSQKQYFGCPMDVHMVTGNHGYQFETLMYLWIKEKLENAFDDITVNVTMSKYSVAIDKFSQTEIFALHGDGRNKADELAIMLNSGEKHKLVLHGHLHHLEVDEFSTGSYRVMCPSLMGGNDYSHSLQKNSKAGQIAIRLHRDGPRPVDYFPLS